MSNLPYVVLENRHNGMQAIKLTEEPFSGIMYAYGKVRLDEDEVNSTIHLNFEYEVLDYANKQMSDMKPFEAYIGKILEHLIHEGIRDNSLVYTGGIDENRTKDSGESDL